jgi:hypothetical protein
MESRLDFGSIGAAVTDKVSSVGGSVSSGVDVSEEGEWEFLQHLLHVHPYLCPHNTWKHD